jgi:hypothetical protein
MTDWIDEEAKKLDQETREELENRRATERRAEVINAKGGAYLTELRKDIRHLIDELNAKVLGGEARYLEVPGGFLVEKLRSYPTFTARSDFEEGRDSFTVVVNRHENAYDPAKSTSLILVFDVDDREGLTAKNYRTGRQFADSRDLANTIVKHAYKGGEM